MTIDDGYYTIADFHQMVFDGNYPLDTDTLNIIRFLEQNIIIPPDAGNGAETVQSSSSAIYRRLESSDRMGSGGGGGGGGGGGRRKLGSSSVMGFRRGSNGSTIDWENARNSSYVSKNGGTNTNASSSSASALQFKVTKMETKEGVEKQISDIRGLLNKISAKNYETQKVVVIDHIFATLEGGGDNENLDHRHRIATVIFDIASTNKFLSELYADLYTELVAKMSIFADILDGLVDRYRETIHQINYVDPNIDYDGFCQYNKANDARKAMAAFIVNLMKRDLISKECVLTLVYELQELSRRYMDEENRTNEVDEITENIAVFIVMGKAVLIDHELWKMRVEPNIQEFTKLRAKEHVSLSSRVVFKYMDF